MIRRDDLLDAIAECQGQKNPNANTCIKLAAYYTILNHLDKEEDGKGEEGFSMRSYAPFRLPDVEDYVSSGNLENIVYEGEGEFSEMVHGLPQGEVLPVIDELMSALKVLHPRLYDGVMRKLDGLH